MTRGTYHIEQFGRPDRHRAADSVHDPRGADGRQQVRREPVQPRQSQPEAEHPAPIALAMMDRVDDLPVALERYDDDAQSSAVHPEQNQRRAVDEDAQGLRRRAGILRPVLEHARYVHRKSDGYHHAGGQLKGRMNCAETTARSQEYRNYDASRSGKLSAGPFRCRNVSEM